MRFQLLPISDWMKLWCIFSTCAHNSCIKVNNYKTAKFWDHEDNQFDFADKCVREFEKSQVAYIWFCEFDHCSHVALGDRGVYFWKFNPPLFAGLSLPQTEIRPKHNEGVIWAQNKCYFWIQHPRKPLYGHFVQLYLLLLIFSIFLYFGVICLISPNWGDNSRLIACRRW